jgi:hypothetical protein
MLNLWGYFPACNGVLAPPSTERQCGPRPASIGGRPLKQEEGENPAELFDNIVRKVAAAWTEWMHDEET